MSDMRIDPIVENIPHLASLGNVVPEGYNYAKKLITPGEDVSLPNAYLKWYNIRYPEVTISQELIEESHAFLEAEVKSGRLQIEGQLGFVMLHHVGSALLLLLTTWRLTNELWESINVKNLTRPGTYQPLEFESRHKGTFCVWELGAIWHERHAWVRFLSSNRDEQAKRAYINDRFSGLV